MRHSLYFLQTRDTKQQNKQRGNIMKNLLLTISVLLLSTQAAHSETKTGRMVYSNVKVTESNGFTAVSVTVVNNGSDQQVVSTPCIVKKKSNGRDALVLSINKVSSIVPNMTPGREYRLRFVYPVTGASRLVVYGGGFRFGAGGAIIKY